MKKKILVFDDQEVVALATAMMLEKLGHTVMTWSSHEGVEEQILQANLVISDMTEHEMVHELCRKHGKVLITMSGDFSLNPDLAKPFGADELLSKVRERL